MDFGVNCPFNSNQYCVVVEHNLQKSIIFLMLHNLTNQRNVNTWPHVIHANESKELCHMQALMLPVLFENC